MQCTLCIKYNYKLKTKSTMMLVKIGQKIITKSAVKVHMTSYMYNDAAMKGDERKSCESGKKIKKTLKIPLTSQLAKCFTLDSILPKGTDYTDYQDLLELARLNKVKFFAIAK